MMLQQADVFQADNPLRLDEEHDGSCPCATIYGEGFHIEVHCWRCGSCCEYSGVHVTGTLPPSERRALGEYVRGHNPWTDHTDWSVSLEYSALEGVEEPYAQRPTEHLLREEP